MRATSAIGIGLVAATLVASVACSLRDQADWSDQLVADSPCYRVDLLDGLDEATTDEVRDLYGCLNLSGHFASYGPVVDALDTTSRSGRPAGVELARAVNAMGRADLDVFGLAGVALDLLRSDDRPIEPILDLSLELIYGRSAWDVRHHVTLTEADAISAGVLAPLGPVVPELAGALLDDDLRAAAWAGDLLREPETARWLRTVGSLTTSPRAEVRQPIHALLGSLGEALVASRSPGNDRWSDATGDSARDAIVALTLGVKGGPPLLDTISADAAALLGDAEVRAGLPPTLRDLHAEGHLHALPEELAWLASVNTDGYTLWPGETSAMTTLLRLLHATNRPTSCTVDLWVTTIDLDLGNLAVTLMELMADREPSTLQGGASLLGSVLSWGLTDSLLDRIADSGSCPTLTRQVIDDLAVIDLMASPSARSSTTLFVRALRVLKYAERSRVPELVDLAADLYASGAMGPFEELIRDLDGERLVEDVVDLVPVLVAPGDFDVRAGDEAAPTLRDALDHARWLFDVRDGRTGWQTLKPMVQAAVRHDGTWVAVGNAGPLLADRQSQAARMLDLVEPLLGVDPELALLEPLGDVVADRAVIEPLLGALETPGVGEGLFVAAPRGPHPEVPLAFGARLVVGGALEDLLMMVDRVVGSF